MQSGWRIAALSEKFYAGWRLLLLPLLLKRLLTLLLTLLLLLLLLPYAMASID